MIEQKFALVYVAGAIPSEKDLKKLDAKLKGVTRYEFRNASRFNYRKNDSGEVLQNDAEKCDVLITDIEIVLDAYHDHPTIDAEVRGLHKAARTVESD